MKIQTVIAVEVQFPQDSSNGNARRPSWAEDPLLARPISRYERFRSESSWRAPWKQVACVVEAEDGTWGLGMTTYSGPVVSIINDHLGPLLIGEECMATEKLWDVMTRTSALYSASGLSSYAISAIDLALWDLKGKLLSRPVYELLGGPVRDRITCYATGLDTDWYMELGFTATKIGCPYGPSAGLDGLSKNEELVSKTRDLIGPDVDLMLDCWMAFDLEFAVRLTEKLRPYNLRWVEDCLVPEDLQGFAEMRKRLPWAGLAAGEHWYSTIPFFAAATNRLLDVLQPDVQWAGGVTALVKICHIAESAGISVIPHAGMNDAYGQHLGYAMPAMPWGEMFVGSAPGESLRRGYRATPGMAVPTNGDLVPTDAPGFGIEITRDELDAAAK